VNEHLDSNLLQLIEKGETLRELGNPISADAVFQQALSIVVTNQQKAIVLCHLGLCSQHLGHWDDAKVYFLQALQMAQSGTLPQATVYRLLSTVNIYSDNIEEAIRQADAALEIVRAQGYPPANVVWYTHGLSLCFLTRKNYAYRVRYIINQEIKDWWYSMQNEPRWLRKLVWTKGVMVDIAYAFFPATWDIVRFLVKMATAVGIRVKNKELLS
jgi:tetratricopeptide (TPR) repeat protein